MYHTSRKNVQIRRFHVEPLSFINWRPDEPTAKKGNNHSFTAYTPSVFWQSYSMLLPSLRNHGCSISQNSASVIFEGACISRFCHGYHDFLSKLPLVSTPMLHPLIQTNPLPLNLLWAHSTTNAQTVRALSQRYHHPLSFSQSYSYCLYSSTQPSFGTLDVQRTLCSRSFTNTSSPSSILRFNNVLHGSRISLAAGQPCRLCINA